MSREPATPLVSQLPVGLSSVVASSLALRVAGGLVGLIVVVLLITGAGPPV